MLMSERQHGNDGITFKAHPGEEDFVTDQSKAWDMAYAGKEGRDYAADERSRTNDPNRAKKIDEEAAALERWAGVLYDHPVSEAYAEAHPDATFDPESLRTIERQANGLHMEATNTELRSQYIGWPADIVSAATDPSFTTYVMPRLYGSRSDEPREDEASQAQQAQWDRYDNLVDRANAGDETAIDAMREFYRYVFTDAKRERAATLETLLDDIQSGRASAERP